jgi:hypothetical protein
MYSVKCGPTQKVFSVLWGQLLRLLPGRTARRQLMRWRQFTLINIGRRHTAIRSLNYTSQAKTLQFILNCNSHEVKSIKLQNQMAEPFKQHARPRLLSIIHITTLLLWALTNDVSWPPLTFKSMMETQASHSAADALIESNITSFRDHYSFTTPSTESLYRLVHG